MSANGSPAVTLPAGHAVDWPGTAVGAIRSLPEPERHPTRANLIAAQAALSRATDQCIPVFDAIPLIDERMREDGVAWI
ncbi:MAG: hypothetical protein WAL63_11635 [Solirubrobacteraceae bacterium]